MFEIKLHWQNVYQQKSPLEVSWYQKEPKLSLEMILSTEVAEDTAIIDVGGGTSVLVDYLLQSGYRDLTVLDISAIALAKSKQRLGKLADQIHWVETDVTRFKPPRQYSVWHDRAVFHFLTEQSDRNKYIDRLKSGLCKGGHLIIATFAIGGAQRCSGLEIVQYNAEKIQLELGTDFALVNEKSDIHITPSQQEQKFAYFHFIKDPKPSL
ncbi:MAG: SAM-dependent methyltransferase [Pseudanabaena sp.]|nr:MAG: SAM-dependent methyltransferase [Pseudanabaena sp.]